MTDKVNPKLEAKLPTLTSQLRLLHASYYAKEEPKGASVFVGFWDTGYSHFDGSGQDTPDHLVGAQFHGESWAMETNKSAKMAGYLTRHDCNGLAEADDAALEIETLVCNSKNRNERKHIV